MKYMNPVCASIVKQEPQNWPLLAEGFPVAVSIKAKNWFEYLPQEAHLSGFELHAQSSYLRQRGIFQISCIQPDFEKDWAILQKFNKLYFIYYKQT